MISDLRDFIADVAYFPLRLVQAVVEGVALGWDVTHPNESDFDTINGIPVVKTDKPPTPEAQRMAEAFVEGVPATLYLDGSGAMSVPPLEVAGTGNPKLLLAAAIQLDDWSRHVACPASIYCGSLARQLRDAADVSENASK